MAYRNKTFVSFDGDTDMHYYRLMKAWTRNDGIEFGFYDAHDINTSRDSSQEASIKAQLAERIRNSKNFILLVGEKTRYLTKFVKWEIEQAIRRDLPMIVVNLNRTRHMDTSRCPPAAQDALAIHVPFGPAIIKYALDNWPASDAAHRAAGDTGPYYYKDSVYDELSK